MQTGTLHLYTDLAIKSLDEFVFGSAPHPLRLNNGLVIGGGTVYPELNFTLPSMSIDDSTMPEVRQQYRAMIQDACARAVALNQAGIVVEFELLPDMTLNPVWGAEITAILRETLDDYHAKYGLLSALRVTPNDIREFERPPQLRSGKLWEDMLRSFELCAKEGADLLSIESTGGKEMHDEAIVAGDLPASVFSLGVLASRDMAYLWDAIVDISARYHCIPAGDSACGFANTAMVLAESKYVPKVWAAVIRVMTVARSLVAYERGAVGPSKDCAYEGPYLKAITGYPIALEGAEAAVAHFSPIGNIARATADLWSNESVQNVKLLGGMAPTVSMEQLIYATRLMNTASHHGMADARHLRDWFTESDANLDPQAYVLRPDVVLTLADKIIAEPTPYRRTRLAALATLDVLEQAHANQELALSAQEAQWLKRLRRQATTLPESEDDFIGQMVDEIDSDKVRLGQYGLT